MADCACTQMGPLWECMQKNADYYAPQVEALASGRGPSPSSADGQEQAGAAVVTGHQTASVSVADGSTSSATSIATFDIDKATDEDIEAYLEQLDKEDSKTGGK